MVAFMDLGKAENGFRLPFGRMMDSNTANELTRVFWEVLDVVGFQSLVF
jgi:hypothetical protein